MKNPYPDLELLQLTFNNETKAVFKTGHGPAIIVMHEVPGLYPGVAQFGREVAAEGFTVYMPSLIGTPGKEFSASYATESIAKACIAKEFTTFASNKNSPITDWLRKLAAHAFKECGGEGVGAVGMCLTGGFALAMMVDDFLKAPVLSQPSLPFGILPAQRRSLGIDDETLKKVQERTQKGACVMGLRFTNDVMVPEERFKRLRDELGDKFIAVEIDSSIGNADNISPVAHSVLVLDRKKNVNHPTQKAYLQVLDFFKTQLNIIDV